MKTVKINLYSFDELSESAKETAIYEHIEFMDSLPEEYENEAGELVSEYVSHTEEEAKDSIKANDYFFFPDGNLAYCVTYCGVHPKSGTTEFNFHGEVYQIN